MTMQEVRAELKNRNTLEELFDLVKNTSARIEGAADDAVSLPLNITRINVVKITAHI